MALDKVLIGYRIRRIREEILNESRAEFAKRCDLTERHIGQLERGDYLVSLTTLDKIASATGIDADFILYGKNKNNKLGIKEILDTLINKADKEDLKMYYKCITTIKGYITKKDKNKR